MGLAFAKKSNGRHEENQLSIPLHCFMFKKGLYKFNIWQYSYFRYTRIWEILYF